MNNQREETTTQENDDDDNKCVCRFGVFARKEIV